MFLPPVRCGTGNISPCTLSVNSGHLTQIRDDHLSIFHEDLLSQQCYDSAVFHVCLAYSDSRRQSKALHVGSVDAVPCHGSSIVFHPHCAEWDFSSKCPRVSLMALPLWQPPLHACGAVTGHTRHHSAKCSPALSHSGALCVLWHKDTTTGLQQTWAATHVGSLTYLLCTENSLNNRRALTLTPG